MKISEVLKRGNNNLDLLRLLAAIAVIVGHAYAISPQEGKTDLVLRLLKFDYSGSLAVKFFFFVSGLLVTKSLLDKPSLGGFVLSRSMRLFPALIACVLISVFVIGPVMTTEPLSEYFLNPQTRLYIWSNLILDTQWNLPGVFSKNPISTVNGSLWTLPIEFFCYLALSSMAAIGCLSSRLVGSITCVLLIAALAYRPDFMAAFGMPAEAWLYPVYFLVGSLFAMHADRFEINLRVVLGWVIVAVLSKNTVFYQFAVCGAMFLFALWFSTTKAGLSLRLPGDFSYGIYLYGFPMQQISKHFWPEQNVLQNQLSGILFATLCAIASWYLVEKFFIDLATRTRRRLQTTKA